MYTTKAPIHLSIQPSSASSLNRVTGEGPVSDAFHQQAGYAVHKSPAHHLKSPIQLNSQMCILGRKLRMHVYYLFKDSSNDDDFSMSIGKVHRKAD